MSALFTKKKITVEHSTEKEASLVDEIAVAVENIPTTIEAKEEPTDDIDFAGALEKIASGSGEETAISGIMELTRVDGGETQDANLAMKANVSHAGAFTAGQFMADYNDNLGMPMVADALRMVCRWMYTHNSALRGERAKQAFAALNEQQQKEFLLTKEAKGLVQR